MKEEEKQSMEGKYAIELKTYSQLKEFLRAGVWAYCSDCKEHTWHKREEAFQYKCYSCQFKSKEFRTKEFKIKTEKGEKEIKITFNT